ncbi:hypothetical protein Tco_0351437 [Tanacetum coccineum]
MTVATTVTSTVDPATTVKEKFVGSSVFSGDSSSGGAYHTIGGFSDLIGSDFIVGGIRTVIRPDTDLQKVYVPQWSVTNGSRLGAARQMSLSAEVRMRAEYNIRERRRLNSDRKPRRLSVSVPKPADLDAMVTSVKSQNDNLIDQVHRLETSSAGLQDKVAAYENFIDQLNLEGRKLTDVAAYNPSAEADYLSALQRLQSLMVPIHHSLDQRVIGATALSLSLDVSNSRAQKIKENIANHISALRGVFVPLSEPLSATALEGMEGTPDAAPDTTTALSVTFISSSVIPPISTDDYEVAHADGQESAGADGQAVVDENVNPFPNIDGLFPFHMLLC